MTLLRCSWRANENDDDDDDDAERWVVVEVAVKDETVGNTTIHNDNSNNTAVVRDFEP